MSDPPAAVQQDVETRQDAEIPAHDGIASDEQLEHVTEGYIRVTEVFYQWPEYLDRWQINAVKALINPNSMIHPDHPLREKRQDAFRLFNCLETDGHERLCFSLKQIQYLQYYIHEMRLANPAWTEYLAKLSSGNDADQPKEGEELAPPEYVEEENEWLPIPGGIIRAENLADVEMIPILDSRDIKRILNKQKKHNLQIDRKLVDRSKLTSEELTRVEAADDNATSGPGLRRGPERVHERRRPPPEREEGTGWGGFPTKTAGEADEVVSMEKPDHVAWQEEKEETDAKDKEEVANGSEGLLAATKDEAAKDKTVDPAPARILPEPSSKNGQIGIAPAKIDIAVTPAPNAVTNKATVSDEAEDEDVDPQPDALAEQLNKLIDLRAKLESDKPAEDSKPIEAETPKAETYIERYYFDTQQAFVLASAGGLASALSEKEIEAEADNGEGDKAPPIPAEIGRSLFFALELTTWEEDENVVLEVGWAATWFQEKVVPEVDGKVETKTAGNGEKEGPEGRFERMTEYGHIIVQDHILDKRNGKTKPDHRSSYNFGTSIPLAAKDLHRTLKTKLSELAKRSGGGPIYLLLHSTDTDETSFKKLGWKTSGWEKQIQPVGWEYPSYAAAEGVGNVFLIDTAILFGAIEDDQSVQPAIGKTRKQLEAVAGIMFGSDPERAPKACGNAGNHAAYCLQIFLGIVDGLPLSVLRADYQQSQIPIAIDPPTDVVTDKKVDAPTSSSKSTTVSEAVSTDTKTVATPPADYTKAMAAKAESKAASDPPIPSPVQVDDPVEAKLEGKDEAKGKVAEEEDEDEEDEDMGITGVFWEDRAGNIIPLAE